MNPPTVTVQAIFLPVVTFLGLLLVGNEPATVEIVLFLIFMGFSLALAVFYAIFRRRWSAPPSQARTNGDRLMLANAAIAFPTSILICLVAKAVPGWTGIIDGLHGPIWMVAAAAATGVLIPFVPSSFVDWFIIRAFRDGVLGEPACQPHTTEWSRLFAKIWVLQRLVTEFLCFGSAALAAASVAAGTIIATTDDPAIQAAVGALGLAAAVLYPLRRIAQLDDAFEYIMRPSPGLGTWISGKNSEGDRVDGFFVDVSLRPGIQVFAAPRVDDSSLPPENERYIPLRRRDTLAEIDRPTEVCKGRCDHWIQGCDVGQRHTEATSDTITT